MARETSADAPANASPIERVERVYMIHEGKQNPRGAQAWFARQCGREKSIVHRYLTGEVTMDDDVAAVLDRLEEDAAGRLERQAQAIRHHRTL